MTPRVGPGGARGWSGRIRATGIVVAVLTLVAIAARARTFSNPVIGFDEQFYLLVGDRMWRGAVPFVDIFDRKPIGLFLIYAAARAPGGDGFLGYKLVALVAAIATAWLIHRIARRSAGMVASVIAAAVYIAWLNLMEGEGGQAPVFYALPMVAAVAILVSATARGGDPRAPGMRAMLLVGIALQIKYSVLVEGIYFGCWLIRLAWRSGVRGRRLGASIAAWIGCALLPTGLAFAGYAVAGHARAFVFANFLSVMAQGRNGVADQVLGAAAIAGVLALPMLALLLRRKGSPGPKDDATRFLTGWLITAMFSVTAYGRFASPHYAMPILVPLACLIAPGFDRGRAGRSAGLALLTIGLVAGQIVLAIGEANKGGADAAAMVARAARPSARGCIYVYDGYPALYMLTGSCLPTRWAFPGHLATRDEARAAALGVDPVAEVRRILATHPVAIVDDYPRFAGGNPATRRVLRDSLTSDYGLAACVRTGPTRTRLVYRLKVERRPRPLACPSDAALRADG